MDKEVLEVILKKSVADSNIQRIIEVQEAPALAKGENYASLVLRIKLKVVLGNGRIRTKNLIIKKCHLGEGSLQIEKDSKLFRYESMMYLEILKEMEYVMEEFEDYQEPLWCNCYFYEQHRPTLVLEDLNESGFKLVPRQKGLDLEHSLLVLHSLGRFHALAKTLEERGVFVKESFKPYFVLSSSRYIQTFLYAGLKNLATAMKKYWGPKWETVADKMLIPPERFIEKIMEATKLREGDFTCLNHGDCWSNNMMFKYDWQDRPISLRFLDYQLPHYHSPCLDVSYFIYVSVRPEIRRQNYKLLLECYYRSFAGSLKKYGYDKPIPSFEEIEEVMERFSFFGHAIITFLYPTISSDCVAGFDLEKLMQTKGEEGFNEEIYQNPSLVERIGEDLIVMAQKYL